MPNPADTLATSPERADINPSVMEDAQLQAHFAEIVFKHLETSAYAKNRIAKATDINGFGFLTRLFDELAEDPSFQKFSAELLANTEKAAEEGNLRGYLSQFARGIAQSLLNPELTDLSEELKIAIGLDNYEKILDVVNGDKAAFVATLIQASLMFHASICSDAFYKKHNIHQADDWVEKNLTEEQATALSKFTSEITIPTDKIQSDITVEDLETIPLPTEAVDPETMSAAVSELDALSTKISELEIKYKDLVMLKRELQKTADRISVFKDQIDMGLSPDVSKATTLVKNSRDQLAKLEDLTKPENAAKFAQLVKLEKLAQQLNTVEIQLDNYIQALEQHDARDGKEMIVDDLKKLIATLREVRTSNIKNEFDAVLNDRKATADLQESVTKIKEAFQQRQESTLYNPRERNWVETILHNIANAFGFDYTPAEVKEATTKTNEAKQAIKNLKEMAPDENEQQAAIKPP